MNSALMSNVPAFAASVRAFMKARIVTKRNGQAPGHPPLEQSIDQDQNSDTYGQLIDVNVGDFVVSTPNGPTPVTVAGRCMLANARTTAECVLSGTHTIASLDQINQELERQRVARSTALADDLKSAAGNRKPFTIRTPQAGE